MPSKKSYSASKRGNKKILHIADALTACALNPVQSYPEELFHCHVTGCGTTFSSSEEKQQHEVTVH